MGKDIALIEKYQSFYDKVRQLVRDDEIYPELKNEDYVEFVSNNNWLGVPSFSMSKKEMTNSDNAHISFRVEDNRLTADLFFNGVKAINRFINILHVVSQKERESLIEAIKKLSDKYSILVQYDVRVPRSSANWTPVTPPMKCKELTSEKIEDLLKIIKSTKERRDTEQKEFGTKKVVTMSVSLGRIELENYTDEQIKEIFTNLANLTRIVHNIMPVRKIQKLEKNLPNSIFTLESEIKRDTEHLDKIKGLRGVAGFSDIDIEKLEKNLEEKKQKLDSLKDMKRKISRQEAPVEEEEDTTSKESE